MPEILLLFRYRDFFILWVIMKKNIRFDKATIKTDFSETSEGFLKGRAIVTRTGIFNYKDIDGGLIRELRHPDDVFDSVSTNSLKMIPVTLEHPEDFVNSKNVSILGKGMTGEDVTVDGKYLIVSFVVTNQDAIDAINQGKRELSLGYETDLIDEPGQYNGVNYDVRQTNIIYNHLAIVDNARAGSEAKINMDCADFRVQSSDEINNEGDKPMPKLRIDSTDYEVSQEVMEAYNRKMDAMTEEMEKSKKEKSKDEGSIEALKKTIEQKDAEIAKLKEDMKNVKKDSADKIREEIKNRINLEEKASVILGSDVKLDSMDDVTIKREIVKKVTNIDCSNYSVERVDGAFEIAVVTATSSDNQMEEMYNKRQDSQEESPMDKMKNDIENRWKREVE